mmetsp:Transcript_127435/g.330397  ORF Transcript_127435/g.330397 Transcript_127435/m.330397 type:complete len:207 (-) Transcript_127435:139-759(-)
MSPAHFKLCGCVSKQQVRTKCPTPGGCAPLADGTNQSATASQDALARNLPLSDQATTVVECLWPPSSNVNLDNRTDPRDDEGVFPLPPPAAPAEGARRSARATRRRAGPPGSARREPSGCQAKESLSFPMTTFGHTMALYRSLPSFSPKTASAPLVSAAARNSPTGSKARHRTAALLPERRSRRRGPDSVERSHTESLPSSTAMPR